MSKRLPIRTAGSWPFLIASRTLVALRLVRSLTSSTEYDNLVALPWAASGLDIEPSAIESRDGDIAAGKWLTTGAPFTKNVGDVRHVKIV